MNRKRLLSLCALCLVFSLSACSWSSEPEALSGVAPSTVDVTPTPMAANSEFLYDGDLSLADSFNQMNTLRISVCDEMYSAVVNFSNESAWVPIAANSYALGSDEFLAASYVMEIEPRITTKKLMRENGFRNIEITPLDLENTWKITANKADENGVVNDYEYTVMYGAQSDSYRFTLSINAEPNLMLASRRITGGYAIQVWVPDGEYHILVHDIQEGRFGYIPKQRDAEVKFPDTDIYYDYSLVTNNFTTKGAEYTFLLANNILYIAKDGSNYAIPLS